MSPVQHTLIETKLGWIGLAWSPSGIVRLHLPAADRAATERGLVKNLDSSEAETLPAFVAAAVGLVRRYAEGERVDFSGVPVALDGVDPMRRAMYAALRRVGHGETLTYGQLAERAGFPGLARDIGAAMGRNPVPLIIPCHRVLAAGGKIGGFSAPGGTTTKQRMLALENVTLGSPPPAQQAFAF
ncbi:MAG: methylated-DNA--[protein]-cysteine S-methyltransferase [Mesorhizobium sp.]|nr:methylated-DNA--[protein]-cysteine S-methyltransferase [Mesorhizobium sp.]